jgi:hypothetical protein
MSRESFNWSLLDRKKLIAILNGARKSVVGQRLSIEKLHKILAQQIRSQLPVKVKFQRRADQEHGLVYIGGCYYGDSDKGKKSAYVEIIFSYFMWDEYLKITQYRWQKMCEVFADTVLHEIIHIRQYRSRNWKSLVGYESQAELAKTRKNQNYYGHPDEIGAYAFNIACELYNRFGKKHFSIQKYLNSNNCKKHKRTTYSTYLSIFEMNHSHPVIKRLKKKVMFYLPYAEFGKPFKTSDFINY